MFYLKYGIIISSTLKGSCPNAKRTKQRILPASIHFNANFEGHGDTVITPQYNNCNTFARQDAHPTSD